MHPIRATRQPDLFSPNSQAQPIRVAGGHLDFIATHCAVCPTAAVPNHLPLAGQVRV
jgi:hypothetical protein